MLHNCSPQCCSIYGEFDKSKIYAKMATGLAQSFYQVYVPKIQVWRGYIICDVLVTASISYNVQIAVFDGLLSQQTKLCVSSVLLNSTHIVTRTEHREAMHRIKSQNMNGDLYKNPLTPPYATGNVAPTNSTMPSNNQITSVFQS